LALLLAVVSSFRSQVLDQHLMVIGEVGLSGEIRPVPSGQERLQEAVKHGFKRAIVPKANTTKSGIAGMKVLAVQKLGEVIDALMELE
jgi:DNA repair protein RadA/Sms